MSETVQEPVTEPETEPDEGTDVPAEPDEDAETDAEMVAAADPQGAAESPQQTQDAADPMDPRIVESHKKWVNFEKAVRGIWGDYQQNLIECPMCFPSHKGLFDTNDRGQYPEQLVSAINELLRGATQADYVLATHVQQCGTCQGLGQVLSGSKVPGKERVVCPTCKGNGFQGQGTIAGQPQSENGQVEVQFPSDTQPVSQDDNDAWGSPRLLDDGQENPNYGRAPSYKNPSLP